MKVIGAGFGRTGTASLKVALEHLGFGPCYHMYDVKQEPRRAADWRAAARGEPVDWSRVFAGYQSTVDWPGAAFWPELVAAYPNTPVILTVRDPQSWYDSATRTIFRSARPMQSPVQRLLFPVVTGLSADLRAFVRMADETVVQRVFDGRIADRAHAIEVFERHIEQVRRAVPADRLLVYRVSDGWGPLCDFLGVPVPQVPFPKGNDLSAYRRQNRGRQMRLLFAPVRAVLRSGR